MSARGHFVAACLRGFDNYRAHHQASNSGNVSWRNNSSSEKSEQTRTISMEMKLEILSKITYEMLLQYEAHYAARGA